MSSVFAQFPDALIRPKVVLNHQIAHPTFGDPARRPGREN
jgi:hypothetical protein